MPTWAWIIIVVAAAIVVAGAIAAYMARQNQTKRLQERFGLGVRPDRVGVAASSVRPRRSSPSASASENSSTSCRSRRRRERSTRRSWQDVQTRFVDDPPSAVDDADRLVTDVMRERGYPMDDFDQRAADISVDHPHVVENYRAAHEIYLQRQTVAPAPRTCARHSSTTARSSTSCSRRARPPVRRHADDD